MRAWRDLPTLRHVERFDAWLYRLLIRACTDSGRDRRHWQAGLVLLPREPAVGDASRALADRDQLDRGLQRLPTEQRTLLVLRYCAMEALRAGQPARYGHRGCHDQRPVPVQRPDRAGFTVSSEPLSDRQTF